MLQEHAGGGAADPGAVVDADPVDPVDPDKAALDAEPPKDDADTEKKASGMDAKPAPTLKELMAQVSRRDALAKQVSAHVGTFDHSAMDEADVAAYAVQKLGLKAGKGQEAAVLDGFLQAAKDPRTEPVATSAAMDSGADNFVTRHLNKGV